jgi:C-terminal processing protease CtpA/Prc
VQGLGDPRSTFLSAAEYEFYAKRVNGSSPDLGLLVRFDDTADDGLGGIVVTDVQPRSPAQVAGLQKGDLITKVSADGRELLTVENISPESAALGIIELQKLHHLSEDIAVTHVQLTYQRDAVTSTVNVMLGHELPTVFTNMSENGDVGIIRITAFYKSTPAQLDTALRDFVSNSGADTYILDLRGCNEGILADTLKALDIIVPVGSDPNGMALVTGGDGKQTPYPSDVVKTTPPAAVLIDRATSGYAELFAYDMRAYYTGSVLVVGVNSAGNNTVQEIFEMEKTGGAILLTTAIVTPHGGDTEKGSGYADTGVIPVVRADANLSANLDAVVAAGRLEQPVAAAILEQFTSPANP